tara:strand:+ start:672 stop:1166 length:495 start_codon:yes stop_codon:yes gene_type:complete
MKKIFFIIISSSILLSSCDAVRDSAGVNRKQIDEYAVIENPPLVIPPNFNLLPPDQINSKDIIDADSDLAKEILFGLDDIEVENNKQALISEIIKETEANEVNDDIRNSINEEFANEKSTINDETIFNSDEELDNAIAETEININKKDNKKSNKEKKKKRFFFF